MVRTDADLIDGHMAKYGAKLRAISVVRTDADLIDGHSNICKFSTTGRAVVRTDADLIDGHILNVGSVVLHHSWSAPMRT